MRNQNITDYLNYFIKLEMPQYAVLLRGKWGCGKTFFIKKWIENFTNPDENPDESLYFKPIYISLNGISKLSAINDKIKKAIHPILYSKGVKIAKKVVTGIIKTCVNINFNSDKDSESDGSFEFSLDSLSFLLDNNNEIKGNKILIFDDLERCKIDIDELFGYINNFVEHSDCKVILIGDEDKILPKDKKEELKEKNTTNNSKFSLEEIKEKLIGQSFELKSDIEDAVNYFIKETEKVNKNIDLNEYKDLIIELFNFSKINNLRILKQSMFDLCRFSKHIDTAIINSNNFIDYSRNLISYFILIYLEYKSGNINETYFQNSFIKSMIVNAEKTEFDNKYESLIIEKKLSKSNNVLPVSFILDFIKYGKIDAVELNKNINYTIFFRINEFAPWEKLWNWATLSNSEFKNNTTFLWSQLYKAKFDDLGILLHVAGIFLDLNNRNLFIKNKTQIVSKTKKNIDYIFKTIKTSKLNVPLLFNQAAYGKGYIAYESPEFIEIYNYYTNKLKNSQLMETSVYLRSVFYNIDNASIDELYDKINEVLPDKSTRYEYSAILNHISAKKFGNKLLSLNTQSIDKFRLFLAYRYIPERNNITSYLQPYHLLELPFIQDLNEFLNLNIGKQKLVKKYIIQELINFLEKIIVKMVSIKEQNTTI